MNQESRSWKVGDLSKYEHDREQLHVLLLSETPMVWIDEVGKADKLKAELSFLHNTRLHYNYMGDRIAEADFQNGLFTPYFEIL